MRPVHIAVLVVGLSLLAGCSGSESPPTATNKASEPTASTKSTTQQGLKLRGTVLLDGAVNDCGDEHITVQVLDATGVVGSQLVDSEVRGVDCTFPFEVEVPELDCYQLLIEGQPVGRYPSSLVKNGSGTVGIITSKSVYGDHPASTQKPPVNADYNGC